MAAAVRGGPEESGDFQPREFRLSHPGDYVVSGVPLPLFTAPATLTLLESGSGRPVSEEVLFDGLATLQRLNLVTLDLDVPHYAVMVHPVLRRVVQERASMDLITDVVYTAVVAMLEVGQGDSSDDMDRALEDCGKVLHSIMRMPIFEQWGNPLSLLTRHNLCHYRYYTHGVSDNNERYFVRENNCLEQLADLVARRTAELGADHRDTLTARHNLARMQGVDGDLTGAVVTLSELLEDYRRVMGPDHPHTLTTRHNLAYWCAESGDVERAITDLEALVPDRERVLGPDHPHTVVSRYNLKYLREAI